MTVGSSRLAAVILVLLVTVANGLRLETPTSSEAVHPTTATPESEQAITNSDGRRQSNKGGSIGAIGERVRKSATIKRVIIGVYAMVMSGLGFYIAWCQFNEAKSIPPAILEHNIELAYDALRDPELHRPCLDDSNYSGECSTQYFYTIFFGSLAIMFFYQAVRRILGLGKYNTTKVADEGVSGQNNPSNEGSNKYKSLKSTVLLAKSVKTKYKSYELGVGGRNFWYKSIALLAFDIVMQSVKCFSGDGAYAKASAELMIAQITLMVVDVILSMLAFYFQNTFSFAAVNENAELGYLAIRLSRSGHLGMRVTGFLDFVTLATPFVSGVHEIGVMSKFIHENPAPRTKSAKSKRRWAVFAVVAALLATIVGSVLISNAVHAGFVAECPAISSQGPPSDDDFLPSGVYCEMWDFNFYLDPPCVCKFLRFRNPTGGKKVVCTAPTLQDPDHKVLQPIMPFIRDALFMEVVWSTHCPIIKEDLQLIASFRKLAYLRFVLFSFPGGLGPEFGQLENLVREINS